jgi:hypothetical protein
MPFPHLMARTLSDTRARSNLVADLEFGDRRVPGKCSVADLKPQFSA